MKEKKTVKEGRHLEERRLCQKCPRRAGEGERLSMGQGYSKGFSEMQDMRAEIKCTIENLEHRVEETQKAEQKQFGGK